MPRYMRLFTGRSSEPGAPGAAAGKADGRPCEAIVGTTPAQLGRMPDSSTILLVDDEDSVQKLLTYPLERDGFRVVSGAGRRGGAAAFAERAVDLVVLDIMLPKLDGLEVCKRLRAESSVPIIMLTARDDEFDTVLGLELGADDYITKPFSIREFRSRVRALLRRAGAPGVTSAEAEPLGRGALYARSRPPRGECRRPRARPDLRRVRAAADARRPAGQGLQPPRPPAGDLGRLLLPRAADDRRPRPPPAREARAGPERAGADPHRPRRRLPAARAVRHFRTSAPGSAWRSCWSSPRCSRSST